MKILLTLLAIGILTGCSSTPPELPEWDIPRATEEAQAPLTLPERPKATVTDVGGAMFTAQGMQQLKRFVVASEANYDIAQANAEALEAQSKAFNALIDAGTVQREVAQIRQELLETERRDHFIDNWFHRGVIILGLLVVAL